MSHPMYNPRGPFPGQRTVVPSQYGMNHPQNMMMQGGHMGSQGMQGMQPQGTLPQMMPQQMGFQGPLHRPSPPVQNTLSKIDMQIRSTQDEVRMLSQVLQQMNPRLKKEKMEGVLPPRPSQEKQRMMSRVEDRGQDWSSYQAPPTKLFASWFRDAPERSHAEGKESQPAPRSVESRQNRYTTESTTSILASFGLSNEDLEELSLYPDEQLTSDNLPFILRDIKLQKMKRHLSGVDRPPSSPGGGEVVGSELQHSKVIDYGHSSKIGCSEQPVERPIYKQEVPAKEQAFGGPSSMQLKFAIETLVSKDNRGRHTFSNRFAKTDLPVDKMSQTTLPGSAARALNKQATSQNPVSKPTISNPLRASQVEGSGLAKAFPLSKGSWTLAFPVSDSSLSKRLPTPTMKNDYYAASPRIFPHTCSLCNIECIQLQDWIEHQNTALHIERCRHFRHQYPDWEPEILPNLRNVSNVPQQSKSPKRRTRSISPSQRRYWGRPWSRSRSGSRGRVRYSRSRSRSPPRYRRSRSRSPPRRRPRFRPRRSRSPSPQHRRTCSRTPPRRSWSPPPACRSPHRVSPHRVSPRRCNRSISSERLAKKLIQSTGLSASENTSLEAMMQTLAPAILAELAKKKSASASVSSSTFKLHGSKTQSKPSATATKKKSGSSANTKKEISSSTVSARNTEAISEKDSKTVDQDIAVEGIIKPKNINGVTVRISDLPESKYTDQDFIQTFQPFGEVSRVLLIKRKKEAFVTMQFEEAAKAVIEFARTDHLLIRGRRVKVTLEGKDKKELKKPSPVIQKKEGTNVECIKNTETKNSEAKDGKKLQKKKEKEPVKPVVLITGLPESGYTEKDLTKLAIDFGSSKVVIVPSHKKAYMELSNSTSADAMVNIYKSIPAKLMENELSITLLPTNIDLQSSEAIFKDILGLTRADELNRLPQKLVTISNLPDEGNVTEELLEMVKKLGNVRRSVCLKDKLIIELETPAVAKMVCNHYNEFPYTMQNKVLEFSMSPKAFSREQIQKDLNQKPDKAPKTTTAASKPATSSKAADSSKAVVTAQPTPGSVSVTATPSVTAASVYTVPSQPVVTSNPNPAPLPTSISKPDATSATANASEPTIAAESVDFNQPKTDCKDALTATAGTSKPLESNGLKETSTAITAFNSTSGSSCKSGGLTTEQSKPAVPKTEASSASSLEAACSLPGAKSEPTTLITSLPTSTMPVEDINQSKNSSLSTLTSKTTSKVTVTSPPAQTSKPANENPTTPTVNITVISEPGAASSDAEAVTTQETTNLPAPDSQVSTEAPTDAPEEMDTAASSVTDDVLKVLETSMQEGGALSKVTCISLADGLAQEVSGSNADESSAGSTEMVPVVTASDAKSTPEVQLKEETLAATDNAADAIVPEKPKGVKSNNNPKLACKEASQQAETSAAPDSTRRTRETRRTVAKMEPKKEVGQSSLAQGGRGSATGNRRGREVCSPEGGRQGREVTCSLQDQEKEMKATSHGKKHKSYGSGRSTRSTRSNLKTDVKAKEQEAEDEMFTFNLDEFVTVDEVGDQASAAQDPLKKLTAEGKCREPSPRHHSTPCADPAAKRSRIMETRAPTAERGPGETLAASSSNSEPQDRKESEAATTRLVTLDEVSEGEEGDYTYDEVKVQPGLTGVKDPKVLVTVDEVEGGEGEGVGDLLALVTLDEIVDQEEDGDGGESGACLPAEHSLVTLDETQDEKENALRQEESCPPPSADTSNLPKGGDKYTIEDLSFVTVDELGEEEEEKAQATPPAAKAVRKSIRAKTGRAASEMKEEDMETEGAKSAAASVSNAPPESVVSAQESETGECASTRTMTENEEKVKIEPDPTPLSVGESSNELLDKTEPCEEMALIDAEKCLESKVTELETKREGSPAAKQEALIKQRTVVANQSPAIKTSGKDSKLRRDAVKELEAKRGRSASPHDDRFKMPPFSKDNPIGLEFVVPKAGFFCQLCTLFYANEEVAKKNHCSSLRHYQNMGKYMMKQRAQASSESSKGGSSS
ncbi:zinc finger protein 638-like isoform X2 [Polyodon spathula]|uniref:zinc finger protein 638-like isoform X2 n=1 Tax=Polyodon spathula TaxID=7913 RepID=UPI001B7DBB5F|nr:zinc finger protein 638-like isoform X2 [Polyodon spathula]